MGEETSSRLLAPGTILSGAHVDLRPPRWEEIGYIRQLWADPLTMREVGGPVRDFEDERATRWFARMVDPGSVADCYCLIFARHPERPVGEVSFHHFDPPAGTAVFNVKVQAGERGKGYGPDAMRTLLAFFFGPCGGQIMLDPLAPDNRVGQQTLLRFGFVHDPAGGAEECLLRMTREAFRARYGAL